MLGDDDRSVGVVVDRLLRVLGTLVARRMGIARTTDVGDDHILGESNGGDDEQGNQADGPASRRIVWNWTCHRGIASAVLDCVRWAGS